MLYVKTKLNDQVEIKIELYEDEIVTNCGDCGKEMPVDPEDIVSILDEGNDFVGTTFYCTECSKRGDFK